MLTIGFEYKSGKARMTLNVDKVVMELPQVKQKKLVKIIKAEADENTPQRIIRHCDIESLERTELAEEYRKKLQQCEMSLNECNDKKSDRYKSLRRKKEYNIGALARVTKEADKYLKFKSFMEEEAIR